MTLEADYLIVGAGAQGVIFADEMLTQSEATMILVDRRDHAGGHWNDAYSFVRLHQPSVYYGAGSRPLGSNQIETAGINAGLFEQATGAEVLSHFQDVMRARLLKSGRVKFLSEHDYIGDWTSGHRIRNLKTGQERSVRVAKSLVDTTWFGVETPETHKPSFTIAAGTPFTTPARLTKAFEGVDNFAILGGGKTAMDVVIWLIQNGAEPDRICWVRPRDSWLTNRETAQPGNAGYLRMLQSQRNRLKASSVAENTERLYLELEARDELFRIDRSVYPTMFHGATISRGELEILQMVGNTMRGRRVTALAPGVMHLDGAVQQVPKGTLFVDCTARAFNYKIPKPVFEPGKITPKVIRDGLVSFSVAAIAYIEANYLDDASKNALSAPIPYEEDLVTLPKRYRVEIETQTRWSDDAALRKWARAHRLTGYGRPKDEEAARDAQGLIDEIASLRAGAAQNLDKLIATRTPQMPQRTIEARI
ncbi:MAG: NAD(P)/FAD-dependent oxidoreductase [Pseudomonadota bacterium]